MASSFPVMCLGTSKLPQSLIGDVLIRLLAMLNTAGCRLGGMDTFQILIPEKTGFHIVWNLRVLVRVGE